MSEDAEVNEYRAEVPIQIADRNLKLRFNGRAIRELEKRVGKPLLKFLVESGADKGISMPLSFIYDGVYCGLMHYKDARLSQDFVDEHLADPISAGELVGEAIMAAIQKPGSKGNQPGNEPSGPA